jgi:anion-transporting  ArsA/GET3 family ATPase
MNSTIDQALSRRKIIITCGTGGVGKTTLSAAIAMRGAILGKKMVVVTIDPAKRLATSLGLQSLSNEPTDLTPQLKAAYHKIQKEEQLDPVIPQEITGTLSAIVPDTRKTFEDFVHELAPNPASAQKVINNPIFQIFAREFSGTNEYMALERLLALFELNQYDCIILDTPPTRNTLAFLDAPKTLAQFFEEKLIRWLVLPSNQLLATGMKKALGILEGLTGSGFMTNLFEFASALFKVQANFTANLKRISALLESDSVGFLLVTTPTLETAPELNHFIQVLRAHHFHFEGVAINRSLGYLPPLRTENSEGLPHSEKDKLDQAYEIITALQNREKHVIEHFHKSTGPNLLQNPDLVYAKLPELARDVHSVEDLLHVAMALDARFSQS